MRERIIYETDDGRRFDIKLDAFHHEARLRLADWFGQKGLKGGSRDEDQADTAAAIVLQHWDELKKLMEW